MKKPEDVDYLRDALLLDLSDDDASVTFAKVWEDLQRTEELNKKVGDGGGGVDVLST